MTPPSRLHRLGRAIALAGALSGALAGALTVAGASPGWASGAQAAARHVVNRVERFSFDLPATLTPVPVALAGRSAGRNVRFFAVTSRPSGVVVEDVLVTSYRGRVLVAAPVLRSLLGAPRTRVTVGTARVGFGRVLRATATLGRGRRSVYSVAFLFSRGSRTYAVACNGRNKKLNAAVARVVMASWGR